MMSHRGIDIHRDYDRDESFFPGPLKVVEAAVTLITIAGLLAWVYVLHEGGAFDVILDWIKTYGGDMKFFN